MKETRLQLFINLYDESYSITKKIIKSDVHIFKLHANVYNSALSNMCLKMYTYVYYNTTFAKLFINTEIVLTCVQDESITAGYMQNLYKILTC